MPGIYFTWRVRGEVAPQIADCSTFYLSFQLIKIFNRLSGNLQGQELETASVYIID
jgi:hypothetical protein